MKNILTRNIIKRMKIKVGNLETALFNKNSWYIKVKVPIARKFVIKLQCEQ